MREKNNEFVSSKTRKDMIVRNYYNLWKTKKMMRRKIKIILINIWFNYSFHSCFRLKILSWSFSYLFQFGSDFWETDAILSFTINFVKFLEMDQ